jgi:hypothetical protein
MNNRPFVVYNQGSRGLLWPTTAPVSLETKGQSINHVLALIMSDFLINFAYIHISLDRRIHAGEEQHNIGTEVLGVKVLPTEGKRPRREQKRSEGKAEQMRLDL